MSRAIQGFLFAFLFSISISAYAITDTVSITFQYPETLQMDDGYVHFSSDTYKISGQEGNPAIAAMSYTYLLAAGTQCKSIRIISEEYYDEPINGMLAPASGQFPISEGAPKGYKPQKNQSIYSKDAWFPEQALLSQGPASFRGYGMLMMNLSPCSFNPIKKQCRVLKSIRLLIETESSSKAAKSLSFLRSDEETQAKVRHYCDHTEALESYPVKTQSRNVEWDLLIITSEKLKPAFEEFIALKQKMAYATTLVTTEEIEANYSGIDKQDKIRNCIIDYYENSGISFVVLGGDSDPKNMENNIIPHRGMYLGIMGEEDLPSDMYYGGLDGNWNENGNSRYGEANEVDYFMEVSVGRICVDQLSEATSFINKIIKYSTEPVVADITKALMIGENLDNDPTWGGDSKDDVAYGSSAHGITTAGFPEQFQISTLYDRDHYWSKNQVFSYFNEEGLHMLNHLGHSNTTYNMKMNNADVNERTVTNDGVNHSYVIGFSQGCYNGSFDNRNTAAGSYAGSDCFAENITNMNTGMVASLSNSRYGWYSPSNTNGISQYFDREFFDALFGEEISQIGRMNDDCKHELASWMQEDDYMRWGGMEIILFGDPSMDVWTDVPMEITAAILPESMAFEEQSVSITAGFTGAHIALIQNNKLIGRAISETDGATELTLFQPLENPMPVYVYISGHNRLMMQDSIEVLYSGPFVVSTSGGYIEAEGNTLFNDSIDFGEQIEFWVNVKNYGNANASNIQYTLIDSCAYATIETLGGNGTIDQLASGETQIIESSGNVIKISDSLPDQYPLNFLIAFESETQNWTFPISTKINAPIPEQQQIIWNDAQSTFPNNQPDPGEELIMEVPFSNTGHAALQDVKVTVESLCPFFSFDNEEFEMGNLWQNSEKSANFTIQISSSMSIGESGKIRMNFEAGAYSFSTEHTIFVGLQVEDFESESFEMFDWQMPEKEWKIRYKDPIEGSFYAKSGPISDNNSSALQIQLDIIKDTSISFFVKTSSEINDYLNFYIDNELQGQWSGKSEWQKVEFDVSTGLHDFVWNYEKDGKDSEGYDAAYVDYIIFPPFKRLTTGVDEPIGKEASVYPNPANNSFILKAEAGSTYNIYTMNGRLISSALINNAETSIISKHWPSGIYIIEVLKENQEPNYLKMIKTSF